MKRRFDRSTIAFFRALVRTGRVSAAVRETGVSGARLFERVRTDPDFARCCAAALHAHHHWKRLQERQAGEIVH